MSYSGTYTPSELLSSLRAQNASFSQRMRNRRNPSTLSPAPVGPAKPGSLRAALGAQNEQLNANYARGMAMERRLPDPFAVQHASQPDLRAGRFDIFAPRAPRPEPTPAVSLFAQADANQRRAGGPLPPMSLAAGNTYQDLLTARQSELDDVAAGKVPTLAPGWSGPITPRSPSDVEHSTTATMGRLMSALGAAQPGGTLNGVEGRIPWQTPAEQLDRLKAHMLFGTRNDPEQQVRRLMVESRAQGNPINRMQASYANQLLRSPSTPPSVLLTALAGGPESAAVHPAVLEAKKQMAAEQAKQTAIQSALAGGMKMDAAQLQSLLQGKPMANVAAPAKIKRANMLGNWKEPENAAFNSDQTTPTNEKTTDGRPVVLGPDKVKYAVDPSGMLVRLDEWEKYEGAKAKAVKTKIEQDARDNAGSDVPMPGMF